jgi:threonine dehydratase
VEIAEQPGSFLKFCQTLEQRNITEFNYRRQGSERARILIGVGLTHGHDERVALVAQLRAGGYTVTDMSGNEIAKLHVRYMIGGQARNGADHGHDEMLYRFEFPERPGSLLRFLQAVGSRWNISLFHYRNHGSDYGRVLAGIQVPAAERAEFLTHLNELHYGYVEETANPAYRMFLGA